MIGANCLPLSPFCKSLSERQDANEARSVLSPHQLRRRLKLFERSVANFCARSCRHDNQCVRNCRGSIFDYRVYVGILCNQGNASKAMGHSFCSSLGRSYFLRRSRFRIHANRCLAEISSARPRLSRVFGHMKRARRLLQDCVGRCNGRSAGSTQRLAIKLHGIKGCSFNTCAAPA